MNLLTVILLIILLLAFGGTYPVWAHSMHWGYGPTGGIGLLLLVLLVLALAGKI